MQMDLPQEEFVHVLVENPTIHNTYDEGRYVTYDVVLQTNSLSFTSKQSVVQRRYSEFQWLRRTLIRTTGEDIPSIPMGYRLFGAFNADYLNKRQIILTGFLRKIVKDTLLISNSAFHLFLQTELCPEDMEKLLSLNSILGKGRSMNSLDNARKAYGVHAPRVPARRSEAELSTFGRTNGYHTAGLNVSQSVPVLHGMNEIAQNEHLRSSERAPSTSELFVRNRTESDASTTVNAEVVGSFSVDNASTRMRGNSLRKHMNELQWNDWVVIEEAPEHQLTLKEQLEDLAEVTSDLQPEDFTNVKWNIGDVNLSTTSTDESPTSGSSQGDSSTSLFIQEKKRPEKVASKRHSLEEEICPPLASSKPCCSHSLPTTTHNDIKVKPNSFAKKNGADKDNEQGPDLLHRVRNKPLRKLMKLARPVDQVLKTCEEEPEENTKEPTGLSESENKNEPASKNLSKELDNSDSKTTPQPEKEDPEEKAEVTNVKEFKTMQNQDDCVNANATATTDDKTETTVSAKSENQKPKDPNGSVINEEAGSETSPS